MATYQNISISNAQWILENTTCIVVDIRDEQSYRQGHLPRAVRFNNRIFHQIRKQEQHQIPILVYCYHGISSKDVAQIFSDFGCTNVYSLEGGYASWQANVMPERQAS
jgi:rhodanese-related sulfurtransferase